MHSVLHYYTHSKPHHHLSWYVRQQKHSSVERRMRQECHACCGVPFCGAQAASSTLWPCCSRLWNQHQQQSVFERFCMQIVCWVLIYLSSYASVVLYWIWVLAAMPQQWTAPHPTPLHPTAPWAPQVATCGSDCCLTGMKADLGRLQSQIRSRLDHRSQLSMHSMDSMT